MQLIQISERNGRRVVSARELHQFLGVKTDFTDWCKRMFEYGFEDGVDFSLLKIGERSAHNKIDYALTLDTAKEISMLQRSERGKQARQYFIECERKLKERQQPALPSVKELAMMVIAAEEQREQAEKELSAAKQQIEIEAPKVLFANAVSASKSEILVGELAKILNQNGIDIGQNRLFSWMRQNGYLISRSGTDFNSPTQRSMDLGLFRIKETAIQHADGHVTVSKTPKVTGKGQQYFINKFLQHLKMKTA